jgi:hypothetical protein
VAGAGGARPAAARALGAAARSSAAIAATSSAKERQELQFARCASSSCARAPPAPVRRTARPRRVFARNGSSRVVAFTAVAAFESTAAPSARSTIPATTSSPVMLNDSTCSSPRATRTPAGRGARPCPPRSRPGRCRGCRRRTRRAAAPSRRGRSRRRRSGSARRRAGRPSGSASSAVAPTIAASRVTNRRAAAATMATRPPPLPRTARLISSPEQGPALERVVARGALLLAEARRAAARRRRSGPRGSAGSADGSGTPRRVDRVRARRPRARSLAARPSSGFGIGTAESSAPVYGCFGSRRAVPVAISATLPRYITITRSEMCGRRSGRAR